MCLDEIEHETVGLLRMSYMTLLKHAQNVMRGLGKGHRECIYAKALNVELNRHGIPHRSEVDISVLFDGECVGNCRADLVVENLIVEIKAVHKPPLEALAQVQKYVENLSRIERKKFKGIVLNFCQKTGGVGVYMDNEYSIWISPETREIPALMPALRTNTKGQQCAKEAPKKPVRSRFFSKK
jgi:GxxExxY protein